MYYVLGNLNHDNKHYHKGDKVKLSDEQAAPLLRRGFISTEAPSTESAAQAQRQQSKAPKEQPLVVGGEQMETGEPSFDGETKAASDAEDITPLVSEADPSKDL